MKKAWNVIKLSALLRVLRQARRLSLLEIASCPAIKMGLVITAIKKNRIPINTHELENSDKEKENQIPINTHKPEKVVVARHEAVAGGRSRLSWRSRFVTFLLAIASCPAITMGLVIAAIKKIRIPTNTHESLPRSFPSNFIGTSAHSRIGTLKTTCTFIILTLCSFSCTPATPVQKPVRVKQQVYSYFSEKDFNDFFPMRDKFYTYRAFVQAIKELGLITVKVEKRSVSVYKFTRTDAKTGKATVIRQDEDWNEPWAKQKPYATYKVVYGDFCTEMDMDTNKKELAAFFAHIAHETRHGENGKYNDGLMYTHELDTTLSYIAENDTYPPVKGQKYYGRGPVQLSYNGNYGYASDCIFGDKNILLKNPGLITTDAVVAFKTAIYFWMTPQALKPSAHDVMIGKWKPNADDVSKGRTPGFGMTINIINGEVECNKGDNVFSMNDRIGYYQYFLRKLGVQDNNCACPCAKMQPYN